MESYTRVEGMGPTLVRIIHRPADPCISDVIVPEFVFPPFCTRLQANTMVMVLKRRVKTRVMVDGSFQLESVDTAPVI